MARAKSSILLAALWLSLHCTRAQQTINFTQTVYTSTDADEETQELQETVEPFSALRNPEENNVKLFFEVMPGDAGHLPSQPPAQQSSSPSALGHASTVQSTSRPTTAGRQQQVP